MKRLMAALAAALALSGCGLNMDVPAGTSTGQRPAPGRATTAGELPAVTDNEVATPPGPDEHATRGYHSPATAVQAFASTYINWDAGNVKRRLESLAAASVGQARSALSLQAAQTGADPELAQAGIANHGSVEAVAALKGTPDRYVVVTRESTTARDSAAYQGLAPAWHLAVATVVRRGAGWVISGWQPES